MMIICWILRLGENFRTLEQHECGTLALHLWKYQKWD